LKPLSLAVTKQSSVHWLHAAGTGEAPHEPVVDALHVVGVHAGQVPHTVAHAELYHTDDTFSVLLAAIEDSGGQMLNETDPLSDLYLLLLRELAGRAGHVGGRIEDLRDGVVLDIWRRLLQLLDTVTVGGVAVGQQGDVIRCGRFQTIPHLSNPREHRSTAARGWGY